MASVFDIFGEIDLKTNAFEGSIRGVVSKLKGADAALDSTIARSNKLGDTSATVARRYDKLSEGIKVQRQRLLDNALAFEKGEISAKKFSSVVTSVDKNTASLSSRIKDAKARLDELNETGLTHFQQQITTAVDTANSKLDSFRQRLLAAQAPQASSLWSNLSGFQKTQLSFQLNDVITGLASGQSPFQVLAQQGGQIVQIFQQGKAAQEGITAAANASTVAQAAFAAESDKAAKAIAAAHTSSTLLGASVVSLGAILAAGLVTILAVYRAVQDIEKAAKIRLATEEQITGELNKQRLAIIEFAKERAKAQTGREFDRMLDSAGGGFLANERTAREQELARLQREVDAETSRRGAALSAVGGFADKEKREQFLTQGLGEQKKRIEELRDEIKKLDEAIDNWRSGIRSTVTGQSGIIDVAMAHAAAVRKSIEDQAVEAAKEAEKKRKEMVKKSIADAKKYAEHVKKAGEAVTGIFAATTNNPFTKIFLDGEAAVQKMLEATKGLGSELQNTLRNLLNSQMASRAFATQMDNALKSLDLRRDAGVFISNRLSGLFEGDYLQKQLQTIGATGPLTQYLDPAKLAQLDKQIIRLTEPFINDPDKLTYQQRRLASDARLREAERTDKEKEEDKEIRKQLVEVLKKLNGNKALQIDINDPNSRTTIGGTSSNVDARYGGRR